MFKTQTPHEGSPRSPSNLSGVGGEIRSAFHESTPESAFSAFSPSLYGNSLVRGVGGPLSMGDASTSYMSGVSGVGRKGPTRQTDLLSAADSITNTMSTLVKELGSGKKKVLSFVR